MSIGHNEMFIGHTGMSIRPPDEQKCPLDIQMSIRPLDEQKCPVDTEMSIGHFAEVLDINPNYMKIELERVQKRAFSIICPNMLYIQA